MVYLQMLDTLWKDHLLQMDRLKEGIGLRGYGQKNPLLEYKKEVKSFDDFLKEQKSRSSDLEAKFAAAKEAQKNRAELLQKKFEAAKQNKDLKDPPPSINWD